jgi:hypothetical protein
MLLWSHARVQNADAFVMQTPDDCSGVRVFLTRHNDGFILTQGRIDAGRSGYNETFSDYAAKSAALAKSVGTDQFLWAVDAERGFKKFEMDKLVEYEVQRGPERILGYVDTDLWNKFLYGPKGARLLNHCFSVTRPASGHFSVLLSFPLAEEELFLRRVFVWGTADYPFDVKEEILRPGATTIGFAKTYLRRPSTAERRASRQVRRDHERGIFKD